MLSLILSARKIGRGPSLATVMTLLDLIPARDFNRCVYTVRMIDDIGYNELTGVRAGANGSARNFPDPINTSSQEIAHEYFRNR